MLRINDWSLRLKIILTGIALPGTLLAILFGAYYLSSKQTTVNAYVEKARAICLIAESTRDRMEAKWDAGIFTPQMLRTWADAGETGKILGAVPVVTAWEAAMGKAEEGGYEI